jgi:hypothetical protein
VTITGNLIENVRGRGLRITIASGFNSNQMGVLMAQNTIDRTTDEALHAVVGNPGILASSNRFTNIDTDANGTPSTRAPPPSPRGRARRDPRGPCGRPTSRPRFA